MRLRWCFEKDLSISDYAETRVAKTKVWNALSNQIKVGKWKEILT